MPIRLKGKGSKKFLQSIRLHLSMNYSYMEIDRWGLSTNEDIIRLLYDNRYSNKSAIQIIDEYIQNQRIADIFDFTEDGELIKGRC